MNQLRCVAISHLFVFAFEFLWDDVIRTCMYLFFLGEGRGTVRIHWEVPQAHQKGLEIRHYIQVSMTSYIKKDTYVIQKKRASFCLATFFPFTANYRYT